MSKVLAFALLLVAGDPPPTIALHADRGAFVLLDDDALAYLPDKAPGDTVPAMVVLHGSGGNAATAMSAVVGEASRRGVAVIAPKSRGATWDVVDAAASASVGGFSNPDARLPSGDRKRIARALEALTARVAVDPERTALMGFSDGASMALSLGIADPDRFPYVIAFAPGLVLPGGGRKAAKAQRVLIAHGTADRVIPYSHGAHIVCPKVARGGRQVRFVTTASRHEVDADTLGLALDDFLSPPTRPAAEGCPR